MVEERFDPRARSGDRGPGHAGRGTTSVNCSRWSTEIARAAAGVRWRNLAPPEAGDEEAERVVT